MYSIGNKNFCENKTVDVIEQFKRHIKNKGFPCVGAKSALSRQQMQFLVTGDIRCPRDDIVIYEALRDYALAYKRTPGPFQSFVVLFQAAGILDEQSFEKALWARLQALEQFDAEAGNGYDPRVCPDVDDPNFSLSFAGEAFFVVGLHPGSSRPARRTPCPTLVFNAHDQFESLRADGRYENLKRTIVARDIAYSGEANPMLARFGEASEARQYSGREIEAKWKCPFQRVHL